MQSACLLTRHDVSMHFTADVLSDLVVQLQALQVCTSTLPASPWASSGVGGAMPDAYISLLPQWLHGGLLTCTQAQSKQLHSHVAGHPVGCSMHAAQAWSMVMCVQSETSQGGLCFRWELGV